MDMDNVTILAIAILAAVVVYFLFLRKEPHPPPHPVMNRCVINHLNVMHQVSRQAADLLAFYVLFVNTYGDKTPAKDPLYISLANLLLESSKKEKVCESYKTTKTLIEVFLKNIEIRHPEENRNLAVLIEPTHGSELAKFELSVDFFKKIHATIVSEQGTCCLLDR